MPTGQNENANDLYIVKKKSRADTSLKVREWILVFLSYTVRNQDVPSKIKRTKDFLSIVNQKWSNSKNLVEKGQKKREGQDV